MKWLQDPIKRGRALMTISILLVLALLWPFAIGRDARHLDAYGNGPEDWGLAREALSGTVAETRIYIAGTHALDDIARADEALLLIVGAERRYDRTEVDAITAFLERGGTVVLADEGGFGTDIAAAAGFAFASQRVLDSRNHLGDPTLVVSDASFAGVPYRVIFNAPTALIPLDNAASHTVMARSSPAGAVEGSHLDVNRNGEIDQADQPGPFPLIVRTTVGAGTLLLVADTGLFMNAQLGLVEYENRAFLTAVVRDLAPADAVLLIDESRHAPPAFVAPWENTLRAMARLTGAPIVGAALLALLVIVAVVVYRTTRETDDWSHHIHDLSQAMPAPAHVRADAERTARLASHHISERFNIPMEKVAGMSVERLEDVTGDRDLALAALGKLKSDPTPLFRKFVPATEAEG